MTRSIQYAASLSLLSLVFAFPVLTAIGISVNVSFLAVDTVATVVSLFLLGVMNFAILRMLGGRLSVRGAVVITLYVSSILFMSNLLLTITPELAEEQYFENGTPVEFVLGIRFLSILTIGVVITIVWLVSQARRRAASR